MKPGDRVVGKYDFKILKRKGFMFVCSFRTEEGPQYAKIPIFISSFGIKPKGFNFVFPGDKLPSDHPDYYRRIDQSTFYDQMGRKISLGLDDDYPITGKYTVIYLDNNSEITKFAAQKDDYTLNKEIGSWIGLEKLDPMIIHGIVIRIIYMHAYNADPKTDELSYARNLAYAKAHHGQAVEGLSYIPPPIMVEIKDGALEYALPENLLTLSD